MTETPLGECVIVTRGRTFRLVQIYGYMRCPEDAEMGLQRKGCIPAGHDVLRELVQDRDNCTLASRIIALGGERSYTPQGYRRIFEIYNGRLIETIWSPADYHHDILFLVK